MTDPRNIAHDKRVQHEKKKPSVEVTNGSSHCAPRPGRKPHQEHQPDIETAGHGPDSDEPVESVESGKEP